jgi:hypothetical protein
MKIGIFFDILIENNLIQNYDGLDYLDSFKFDLLQVEE